MKVDIRLVSGRNLGGRAHRPAGRALGIGHRGRLRPHRGAYCGRSPDLRVGDDFVEDVAQSSPRTRRRSSPKSTQGWTAPVHTRMKSRWRDHCRALWEARDELGRPRLRPCGPILAGRRRSSRRRTPSAKPSCRAETLITCRRGLTSSRRKAQQRWEAFGARRRANCAAFKNNAATVGEVLELSEDAVDRVRRRVMGNEMREHLGRAGMDRRARRGRDVVRRARLGEAGITLAALSWMGAYAIADGVLAIIAAWRTRDGLAGPLL